MGRVWGFSASIRLGGAGPIWAGVRLYTLYGVCPGTDASNDIITVLGLVGGALPRTGSAWC